MSFDEIKEANATMDQAELRRFMKDFFPGVFSQKEVNWLFKRANEMGGISDKKVLTLKLDEFVCIVCQMAMQLFAPPAGPCPSLSASHTGSDPLITVVPPTRRISLAGI